MRVALVLVALTLASGCGRGESGAELVGDSGVSVAALEGAALYARRCASCHGATGRGDGVNAPNLDPRPRDHGDRRWSNGRSDAQLAAAIRSGGARMPAFGRSLKSHQISDLVAHLRTLARQKGKKP